MLGVVIACIVSGGFTVISSLFSASKRYDFSLWKVPLQSHSSGASNRMYSCSVAWKFGVDRRWMQMMGVVCAGG